ncbi:MAG TPA: hypothetical protein VE604_07315 [Candidatus Polarisedimenticolia bacterium]|nr:hypothetical protein [Candidatus Polarisedimenticolia bacterium]
MRIILVLALAIASQAQTATSKPAEAKPAEAKPAEAQAPQIDPQLAALKAGIYYKAADKFVAMDQLMMSGGGAKHIGKMFVPGLTPQMVWTYRGSDAPVRIAEPRPVFYFRQAASMPNMPTVPMASYRDLAIVQFDKKKDHRELQTTNGGNMFTFKAGIGKDKLPDIDVEKIEDGLFKITPKQDLKPGEYLISFGGMGYSGYDFGIDSPKK